MPLCWRFQLGEPHHIKLNEIALTRISVLSIIFKVSIWLEKSIWICIGANTTIHHVFKSIPLHGMFYVTRIWELLAYKHSHRRYFNSVVLFSTFFARSFTFYSTKYIRLHQYNIVWWINQGFSVSPQLNYTKDGKADIRRINTLVRKNQSQLRMFKTFANCICGHSDLKQLSALELKTQEVIHSNAIV